MFGLGVGFCTLNKTFQTKYKTYEASDYTKNYKIYRVEIDKKS